MGTIREERKERGGNGNGKRGRKEGKKWKREEKKGREEEKVVEMGVKNGKGGRKGVNMGG